MRPGPPEFSQPLASPEDVGNEQSACGGNGQALIESYCPLVSWSGLLGSE